MSIKPKHYRVEEGSDVDLSEWPTDVEALYQSKEHYEAKLAEQTARLSDQQERLYASNRNALLVIFQGMDTSGKDSAIRRVMSGVNPQGCQVTSFKHPSATELKHDFLWRTHRELPERGRIGIFNRSYYEDVLIVRVHPEILAAQNLPADAIDRPKQLWRERYRSIRDAERHLHANGTRIVKIFLHISKDEQKQRLIKRIDEPDKHWKFDAGDVRERGFWKEYRKAYEAALSATSTERSPWYVVPADDKDNMTLIVSAILLETIEELGLEFPETSEERVRDLMKIRKTLEKD